MPDAGAGVAAGASAGFGGRPNKPPVAGAGAAAGVDVPAVVAVGFEKTVIQNAQFSATS